MESYLIQFHVLQKASRVNLNIPLSSARNRFPHYPTFEDRLPLSWASQTTTERSVFAKDEDLVEPAEVEGRELKPVFQCPCCSPEQPKTYERITKYWSHLVHSHNDIKNELRLQEMIRTAHVWNEYAAHLHKDATTTTLLNDPTMKKVRQLVHTTRVPGWDVVKRWDL